METKICKGCGKEFPISEFKKIGKRSGGFSYLVFCTSCMAKRQAEGFARRRNNKEKELEKQLTDTRKLRLQEFTPRELMEELARRGYEGKLQYTQVHVIDITNF